MSLSIASAKKAAKFPFLRHPHLSSVLELLDKYQDRFTAFFDEGIYNDLALFFSLVSPAYLDSHGSSHVLRLVVGLTHFRIRLLKELSSLPDRRHVIVKFLPSHLAFPLFQKSHSGV